MWQDLWENSFKPKLIATAYYVSGAALTIAAMGCLRLTMFGGFLVLFMVPAIALGIGAVVCYVYAVLVLLGTWLEVPADIRKFRFRRRTQP